MVYCISSPSISVASRRFCRVLSCALVGDLGSEPVLSVRGVRGGLYPPVGKGDGEGSLDVAVGVLRLLLLEVAVVLVIRHGVLVAVGLGRLVGRGVDWGRVGGGRGVGRGLQDVLVGACHSRGQEGEEGEKIELRKCWKYY